MRSDRVERVREQMNKRRLGAFLLTDLNNIRYVSGFTGSTATVVITPDRAVILVDSRYVLQAVEECEGFEVKLYSGDPLNAAADLLNETAAERVGFEADRVTCAAHRKLSSTLDGGIRLIKTEHFFESLRLIKDTDEIIRLRKAAVLADDCFMHLLRWIKPGMTERDVALEIYVYVHKHRAGTAFDTIVAAGPHAALPHAQPGDAVLEKGQMLKMDFGAAVDGYNSDITRTVFLGEPDEKQREIYDVVCEAQSRAIEAIRPGKPAKEVDAVARDYIKSKGYEDYFGHGLGHSIGIEVHDGPGFAATSKVVLASGMVMTVEPGIYIEGWGGVRIEDDVLVTETGVEVLTRSTKGITVVG